MCISTTLGYRWTCPNPNTSPVFVNRKTYMCLVAPEDRASTCASLYVNIATSLQPVPFFVLDLMGYAGGCHWDRSRVLVLMDIMGRLWWPLGCLKARRGTPHSLPTCTLGRPLNYLNHFMYALSACLRRITPIWLCMLRSRYEMRPYA